MHDLVKAYRMHEQMMRYPHLVERMRELFVAVLEERGIMRLEEIKRQALLMLREGAQPTSEANLREYTHALIDLTFSRHFSQEEIENHINLARKQEAFQNLNKAVNTEGMTSLKIKQAMDEFCSIPPGSLYISPNEAEGVRVALINHFISNQLPFIGVAKNHITIRDIGELMEHAFWNRRRAGKIGGKAAGMFLAYKIILPRLRERDPELEHYIAIPESYYFNSGILSDFIDYNGFYSFHSQKYKNRETIEEEYANIAHLFEKASFPPDVIKDFTKFLEAVGERPLILRSSSLLEDNFEFSFSGKYDSIFLGNQGDLKTRLDEFIRGLKLVLMCTFSPSAILYRRDHNLLDFDERMSVLVQEIVGRRFGRYFFPFTAGVAFSQNAYLWTPRIVKEDGIVRLVVGLGTRAVDRTGRDYPRMIPLSHPLLRPEITSEQIRKYSQKTVDVLNLETGRLEAISYLDLFEQIEHPELDLAVSIDQGGYLSPPMFKGQEIDLGQSCITLDGFLMKTRFVSLMKKILKELEKAYGRPVDVEFAWEDGKLYILQCRSLAVREKTGRVSLPEGVPEDQILFTNDRGISNSVIRNIEYIVYVNPKAYARLASYEERMAIVKVVSRMNRILDGKRYALLGPVRWGSNDINYGVKVGYEDINRTLILGEIAFEEEEGTPEVSYGTHFFNDLVEAQIVPLAIYPDDPGMVFNEDVLLKAPSLLASMLPDFAAYDAAVRVVHVPSVTGGRLLQVFLDGQGQKGMGFFSHPEADEESNTPAHPPGSAMLVE